MTYGIGTRIKLNGNVYTVRRTSVEDGVTIFHTEITNRASRAIFMTGYTRETLDTIAQEDGAETRGVS